MDEPDQEVAVASEPAAPSPTHAQTLEHAIATILYKHVKMEDTQISIEVSRFSELLRELVQFVRTGVY